MIIAMNSFISPNVIVAEPSLNGFVKGIDMLKHAEKGNRECVTKLNWPTRWDWPARFYGKPFLEKIKL